MLEELSNTDQHTVWSETQASQLTPRNLESSTILNDSLESINVEYARVMRDSENFLNSPLAAKISETIGGTRDKKRYLDQSVSSFHEDEDSHFSTTIHLKQNDEELYHELNQELDLVKQHIETSIQNEVNYKPKRRRKTSNVSSPDSLFRRYSKAVEACHGLNKELSEALHEFEMKQSMMNESIEEYKSMFAVTDIDLSDFPSTKRNNDGRNDTLTKLIQKSSEIIRDNSSKL